MKEGQTGKYGVWLSECCTDRHRQHARRGLDGSAAAAAAAAEEWNNTSHFVEAATAAGAIQKQQRSSFMDTCKITFTFPNVSVIFYTGTFVYPEFREGYQNNSQCQLIANID
ncbi:hypothetical protein I306_02842 [Cryptococcus gattii EJB2]|uniref:Uncharacterized protein n=1 Tax=Cryptococcus gattii EJB2 TaxID=1296103 RepID=A0ABR5BWT1_9TREE|nr:hypothetical protein I306_02842 [Cryptococcus gattii EJB2]KJE05164.1 hypothetical protein I311_00839 [Cryptococcus gattii NT-10]